SAWAASAAAVALLLTLLPKSQERGSQVAHQGNPTAPRIEMAPAPDALVTPMVVVENIDPQPVEEPGPMVAKVEPVPVPTLVAPAPRPVSSRPDLLPIDVPAVEDERAYAFTEPVSAPAATALAEVPARSR